MSPSAVRHVFLTGQPGVGKTTLVLKAIDALKTSPRTIGGFITTERRDGRGERCGFDVVTVGGDGHHPTSGTLATKAAAGSRPGKGVPAVGNYVVDVADFERVALDVLGRDADGGHRRPDVTVVDEVGKMELHSVDFLPAVHRAMEDESTTVFGTIPMPRYGRTVPAVEAVRDDPRVAVVHVRRDNRDAAAVAVVKALRDGHLDVDALAPFLQEGQAAKLGLAMDGGDGDGDVGGEEDRRVLGRKEPEGCGPLLGGAHASRFRPECFTPGDLPDVEPRVLLLGETSSPKPVGGTALAMYEGRSMWRVMEGFLLSASDEEKGSSADHATLVKAAVRSGVAVWDVLAEVHETAARNGSRRTKRAKRPGAADGAAGAAASNDVMGLLERVHTIESVCFIGAKAKLAFAKRFGGDKNDASMTVKNVPGGGVREVSLIVLPSSSRANARVSMEQKARAWREALLR